MDWLLLVYMAADNDLDADAAADFDAMSKALASDGEPSKVAVVVLLDRLGSTWDGYYELQPQVTLECATKSIDRGELHTSNPQLVRDFLDWGERNYPATNRAMIFWSHGQGWRRMGQDEINALSSQLRLLRVSDTTIDELSRKLRGETIDDRDFERLSGELRNARVDEAQIRRLSLMLHGATRQMAIDEVPVHYDDSDDGSPPGSARSRPLLNHEVAEKLANNELAVLGFDACNMSMIETAYEFRAKAQVMVGSEELLVDWPLPDILKYLQAHSQVAPEKLGKQIVKLSEGPLVQTLAAIRLPAVQALADRVSDLATQLIPRMATDPASIRRVRAGVQEFARGKGLHHVDLIDFVKTLKRDAVGGAFRSFINQIEEADADLVIESYADPAHKDGSPQKDPEKPGAYGLAIYFPPDGGAFENDPFAHDAYDKPHDPPSSVTFVTDQRWADFINTYASKVRR